MLCQVQPVKYIVAYRPVARQQLQKQTRQWPLLGSDPQATMEVLLEAAFSMWSAPRLYHATDPVQLVRQCSGVERVGW
jgi:hypothetical protein